MHRLKSIVLWMTAVCVVSQIGDVHAQPAADFVTVSGSATYRQRIAMPPDAVLTVRVEDVSRADARATVLAETSEPFGARQVPIPFALRVPNTAIDSRMSYAVRATITVGGALRFTTTRHYAVLTRGASNTVDLALDAVQSAQAATTTPGTDQAMAALKDAYWKLVELDGAKVTMAPDQQREIRITLASGGSRVFGFSGCNQFTGTYEQDGAALRFGQMASTMMACISPFMELEGKVIKALGVTTGYRIEGEQLILLADDQVLARFEAVYLR